VIDAIGCRDDIRAARFWRLAAGVPGEPLEAAAMSTREDYPAGVPCWVDTSQPGPAGAARFYCGLFGWQAEDAMPPGAGAHYYMARIGGRDAAAISSQPPGAPPQGVWNTCIRVESAEAAAARVRAAGGRAGAVRAVRRG
jgi:predicted enzyme related to lactoylglutathione lyase